MTEKYSDAARRRIVARASQPTPRAVGRKLHMTVTLYESGHSAINSSPSTVSMLSNDDAELISQFALLIRNLRKQLP